MKIQSESMKIRLLIVTLCNTIISLCFAIIVLALLGTHYIYRCSLLSPAFFLFLFLFLCSDVILNIITTHIILRPIRSLTRDLQRLIENGKSEEIDLQSYPELASLLSSTLKLVDIAKKERDVALLMKNTLEKMGKTIGRDALTSLYNREFLEQYLPGELSRSGVMNKPLSLVMLDVDDFKHYNDTNGHPEGDRVLRKVAELVQGNIRDYDVAIRYGGEEFCIIMPDTPYHNAEKISERIRLAVERGDFPFKEKQPQGNLTVSLGVAAFPEHASNEKDLVKFADIALYQAKRTGKNKVCIYNTQM